MKRAWRWVSLATVLFACNADQFVGPDASGSDASPDVPIVSTGDAGDGGDGGGCGDTQSSSDNCGSCGHSCQGGACNQGVCQPFVFATMPQNHVIESLALDGSRVYVGSDVVYMCPRSGCPSPTPITTTPGYVTASQKNVPGIVPFTQNNAPWIVYVDYGDLGSGTNGYVGRCPVGGCLDAGGGAIFDLPRATSAFVHQSSGYAVGGPVIRQFPLDAGGTATFFTAPNPLSVSAVDDAGDVVFCSPGYGVYACDTSDCSSPTLLSTPATTALSIAIYNGAAYWSDATTGLVDTCPLSGCNNSPTHVMSASPGEIGDIVIGANGRLFFAVNYSGNNPSPNTGLIQTCMVTSCGSPVTLGSSRTLPWRMVAGGSMLYWSEGTQIGQTTPYTTNQVIGLAL